MEGFAFPRRFVKDGLAESLSKNMRALLAFLNERVVRYDAGGVDVTLPGGLTLGGPMDADGNDLSDVGSVTHEHPTSGSVVWDWEDDYWRARFGGTATPAGIRIDDYDTERIELNRDGTIVATSFEGDLVQESWNTPSLSNSWVNYGGAFQDVRYRKDSSGVVHVQGLVKSGTAATVFTLPAGYRPDESLVFATWGGSSAYRLNVASTGEVGFPSGYGATPYMSVSCSFAT